VLLPLPILRSPPSRRFRLCSPSHSPPRLSFFFLKDPPTTEIYTLSLHDALPISLGDQAGEASIEVDVRDRGGTSVRRLENAAGRSEEHTSELQSLTNLVCRLLLEKKKNKQYMIDHYARLTIDQARMSTDSPHSCH